MDVAAAAAAAAAIVDVVVCESQRAKTWHQGLCDGDNLTKTFSGFNIRGNYIYSRKCDKAKSMKRRQEKIQLE